MDKIEEQLEDKLEKAELCFKNSCRQIVCLNQKLWEMKARYNKAQKDNHKAFRYSIRLKIAAAEGIRNAYYEYACVKADEVTSLRNEMINNSDDDDEEEEDFEDNNLDVTDEEVEDNEEDMVVDEEMEQL